MEDNQLAEFKRFDPRVTLLAVSDKPKLALVNQHYHRLRVLHDPAAAPEADMTRAARLAADDPAFTSHHYDSRTIWGRTDICERSKRDVLERAVPLEVSVDLRINSKIKALVPLSAGKVLNGSIGKVVGFQVVSRDTVRGALMSMARNMTFRPNLPSIDQLLGYAAAVFGVADAADEDAEWRLPRARWTNPDTGNFITATLEVVVVDVYAKRTRQLVCSRFALGVNLAWAEMVRNCVGVGADAVWCDLTGSQQRASDAYQVLGRARDPVNGVFWAPNTTIQADMFVAPPAVIAHIDSDDWWELEIAHMPNLAGV